jgi:hypothetical protein
MKRMIGLLLIICLVGCEGKEGLIGPQGEQGEKGGAGPTYVARFNNEDEISTWQKADTGSWRIEDGRLILSGTGIGRQMGVQPNTYFTSDIDISVDTEVAGHH